MVVADTGWAHRWKDSLRYRNEDELSKVHFPGFDVEAVRLLLEKEIVGIGIDTLSPDGGNTTFPVHHLLLPQSKYIIENLSNLDKVTEKGALAISLPIKIHEGAEAPRRCVALVP